jgi:peroxiredoxin
MPKHLQNDQAFPDLAIPAVGGGTLSLPADLAGSYGVILIYRGHWCPFCNEQLAAFASASEALSQEGIKVLAFSADDEATAREVIEKNRIPFKMGHSAEIEAVVGATGAYETRHKTRGHYLESTGFVLSPDAAVVTAVYSSRAIGRLIPSDVIRLVSYLKSLA